MPDYDVTTKDYLVKLSLRQAPLSDNLNLRRLTSIGLDNALRTPFLMDKYLLARGDATVMESMLANPLPTSLMFWGGPGDEPEILQVASAYEAATHHRAPPSDFGPLPGEP